MQKVIVSLLLLDLISVTLQIPGFQANTRVSNSNEISCGGNKTITIVDLNVQKYTTSCTQPKQCNLTEQQSSDIKNNCNEKKSCTISTIIPNSCLFNDYGQVSVSYSCTAIVNSSCTFENGECGWTIQSSERYKWKLQRGKTPETYTGPDRDHTTASANGQYMYTESNSESIFNDESDLFTGVIVRSPKQCLTFWYHMYGSDIKTLKVFQLNREHTIELWRKSHNQGNKWYFQSLALKDIGPYKINFKAIRGDGDKSDIAIDDILITNTVCKKDIDCDFETGQCGWKTEETTYKWTNWHDRTPSSSTGPDVDHTLGTSAGEYIYLEASGISKGRISHLTSRTVYPDGDACFTFWYYMYGRDIGTLNVYLDFEDVSTIAWSKSGNIGEIWLLASLSISSSEPYKIIFEGIRGKDSKGDIALDDIVLLPGLCEEGLSLDCNFEGGKCYWSTDSDTPYYWEILAGSTLSVGTGPDNDHTTGLADGHYMYLEGTNVEEGIKSKLTSKTISPYGDICFSFWYHMYGENIGILNVYTEAGNITTRQWSRYGNQGNVWKFANFTISKSEPFRIIFEGTSGDDYKSDIALDDIVLLERSCSGYIKTSQTCHNLGESISLDECSKYYLQLNETSFVFDQEFDNCSDVYQDVQTSRTTLCNDLNNSDICTFSLPELFMKDKRCFQSNMLLVEYKCEAEESFTFSSVMTSKEGSSKVSDTSVTLSAAMKNSSNSATGLVVGLVIGGLILACVVILAVVLIRRHTFKSNPKEKIRNNLGGNDYIESQDIALPLTANHSSHMQNNGMYDRSSNTSVLGYDSRHANAHINNIQHEYINLGVANDFVDKERVQAPTYALRGNKTSPENDPSNDDEYAIVDSTAETSFNETKDDRTGTADSFVVLNPNDTGFSRTAFTNTATGYEFAKPVGDTENKICDKDQYDISDEGVYDHSGSNRHKELENNIYNHAVDTIYDSGCHKRNNEGREDTYDHFFGQKTEDDYDISTTT